MTRRPPTEWEQVQTQAKKIVGARGFRQLSDHLLVAYRDAIALTDALKAERLGNDRLHSRLTRKHADKKLKSLGANLREALRILSENQQLTYHLAFELMPDRPMGDWRDLTEAVAGVAERGMPVGGVLWHPRLPASVYRGKGGMPNEQLQGVLRYVARAFTNAGLKPTQTRTGRFAKVALLVFNATGYRRNKLEPHELASAISFARRAHAVGVEPEKPANG